MYEENALLPLSALQHLIFCERQCALIHSERIWEENRFTLEGRFMHERVDRVGSVQRSDVKRAYGVRLRSLRLGLTGKADLIEFHRMPLLNSGPSESPEDELRNDVPSMGDGPSYQVEKKSILDEPWRWQPFPVEYKRGRPKKDFSDKIQLCAQALCLEEMLGVEVTSGAIFYGSQRKRIQVQFSEELRVLTEQSATRLHVLIESQVTPQACYMSKCDNCSLYDLCLPKTVNQKNSVRQYLLQHLK